MGTADSVSASGWLEAVLNSVFVFILPTVGALGALATLLQGRVAGTHVALLVIGFLATGLGVTVGYHRLLAHRSFETHPAIKAILLVLGSMAVEGPAVLWVANHVKHHVYADRPQDPHTPRHGFMHAHWGWLFNFSAVDVSRYAVSTLHDRVAGWVSNTFILWVIVGYLVPTLVAGWEGLIWGGLFRQFAVQHVTFAVNSVCHRWGSRPFQTKDLSRNNWLVAALGLGEGWHNNHHAFPVSAFHGLRWWEVDVSGQLIRQMEAIGLAWNVKRPDRQQVQRKLADPTMMPLYERAVAERP